MAHNINMEDGKASMMYTDSTPWHKLGTKLDKPATSAEAIKAANLDWQVIKIPLFAIGRDRMLKSDKHAVVREDKWGKEDSKVLGVVSDSYTPVQNNEAFKFFDDIVGEGKAIYHTAGVLGNGERVWILAKLPGSIVLTKEDTVDKFLLLANGHDGNMSIQIKFTPIRVVCQNTLTQALTVDNSGLKIPHHRNVHSQLSSATETLGIIKNRYQELESIFKKMLTMSMTPLEISNYYKKVFPDPKLIKTKRDISDQKMMQEMRHNSLYYFEEGLGNKLKDVKGSLWAAYNGITEYIDHHKKVKNGAEKLNYIWFGGGNSIKTVAFNEATKLMGHITS